MTLLLFWVRRWNLRSWIRQERISIWCDLCAVWVTVLTTWLLSEGRSTFLWGFWWAPESPWGIGRPPKQTSAFWTETASKTNISKRNRCRRTKPQTQRSHTEYVSWSYSCSLLETGFGSLGQPYFSTQVFKLCILMCSYHLFVVLLHCHVKSHSGDHVGQLRRQKR